MEEWRAGSIQVELSPSIYILASKRNGTLYIDVTGTW